MPTAECVALRSLTSEPFGSPFGVLRPGFTKQLQAGTVKHFALQLATENASRKLV